MGMDAVKLHNDKKSHESNIKVVHVMYILNICMMYHYTYDVKPGVMGLDAVFQNIYTQN